SNFLPPALGWPLGSVWQPQPPAAPKMYLPRVTSAGSAAKAAPAHQVTRQVARRSRRTAVILTQSPRHRFPLPSRLSWRLAAVGGLRHGSPDPSAIHPDPHGLLLAASLGGQEEDLGERGHADGVAASCPEGGADARGRTNAIALAELGAKLGRLPRRIALLVHL